MKISIVTLLLLSIALASNSQEIAFPRDTFANEMSRTDYYPNSNLTITGLNLFLAKKSIRYLSDDADVSLYKNFFIANVADSKLTLGRNIVFKESPQSGGRVRALLTPSIQAKAEDNFSELFAKGEFKEGISAGMKFTLFFNGSTTFDRPKDRTQTAGGKWLKPPSQQRYMAQQRVLNFYQVESEFNDQAEVVAVALEQMERRERAMRDTVVVAMRRSQKTEGEITAFIQVEDSLIQVRVEQFRAEKQADLSKKTVKDWYDAEVKSFETKEAHNLVKSHWISAWTNYTLVGEKLNIYDSAKSKMDEVKFRGVDANLLYTRLYDGYKCGIWYFSVGGGLIYQNSILTKQGIKKYDLSDYSQNAKPDTLQLVKIDDTEFYSGDYKTHISQKLIGQIVWLFPKVTIGHRTIWNKNFGLSIKAEKWIGTYDPTNITLGLPMILSGKDDDKKINLEIQFKWVDVRQNIKSLDKDDRYSAGVNLAIPFSSVIY